MSSLQRKTMCELNFDITNAIVVALIIGKTEPRTFISKNSGEERAVIGFTIRDGDRYFTNCTYWGSVSNVEEYDQSFRIGDIVDVVSPKILSVSGGDRFQPKVSLPIQLSLNEGVGCLQRHLANTSSYNELIQLCQIPLKPTNFALNLADIHASNSQMAEQYVDLLVIIKKCREARSILTKKANMRTCLEVIVMDKSLPSGILMTIWHKEWIEQAQLKWKPLETVLHLIDVRVEYSSYYKTTVLGLNSRTLLVENPKSPETNKLKIFAQTIPNSEEDLFCRTNIELPSLASITNVMTIEQICNRAEKLPEGGGGDLFSAVLYAVVTKFNLDDFTSAVKKQCKLCKSIFPANERICPSDQCQITILSANNDVNFFELCFNINTHLTDHTGTLTCAKLYTDCAERILETSALEFQGLGSQQKSDLKWKYLMERCTIKLIIRNRQNSKGHWAAIIMDMQKADINEVAENILVY